MRKILVFQHVASEPLGHLDPLLRASGVRIRYVNFGREPHAQPDVRRYEYWRGSEPDTYYTLPARAHIAGRWQRGYLIYDRTAAGDSISTGSGKAAESGTPSIQTVRLRWSSLASKFTQCQLP